MPSIGQGSCPFDSDFVSWKLSYKIDNWKHHLLEVLSTIESSLWSGFVTKWMASQSQWTAQLLSLAPEKFKCSRGHLQFKKAPTINWHSADTTLVAKKLFCCCPHCHGIGSIIRPGMCLVKLSLPPAVYQLFTQLLQHPQRHTIPGGILGITSGKTVPRSTSIYSSGHLPFPPIGQPELQQEHQPGPLFPYVSGGGPSKLHPSIGRFCVPMSLKLTQQWSDLTMIRESHKNPLISDYLPPAQNNMPNPELLTMQPHFEVNVRSSQEDVLATEETWAAKHRHPDLEESLTKDKTTCFQVSMPRVAM